MVTLLLQVDVASSLPGTRETQCFCFVMNSAVYDLRSTEISEPEKHGPGGNGVLPKLQEWTNAMPMVKSLLDHEGSC